MSSAAQEGAGNRREQAPEGCRHGHHLLEDRVWRHRNMPHFVTCTVRSPSRRNSTRHSSVRHQGFAPATLWWWCLSERCAFC